MLRKLFVHEWKDTWKLLTVLNLVVLVLTIIGMVTIGNDVWKKMDESPVVAITFTSYFMFYFIAIAALSMCVSLYFWFRFYKNLYTDQGYLMHTLPVTSHQLIISKGLVALIWQLISVLVTIVSIGSLALASVKSAGRTFKEIFQIMLTEMEITGSVAYVIVATCLFCIAALIMAILMGYTAVSVGQLFKKHRLGAAVGVYIGLYMIVQTISSFATIPFSMGAARINTEYEMTMYMGNLFILAFAITTMVSVAFYCITNYIMKSKLNLE